MDEKINITKKDAIFFMDMINSIWSPNFKAQLFKKRSYYNILKEKDSDDSKRFKSVYKAVKYILTEREQIVLDEIYGVYNDCSQLKTIAAMLNISPERVRQISREGENKLAKRLSLIIGNTER